MASSMINTSMTTDNGNPRESISSLVMKVARCPDCLEVPRGKIFCCVMNHDICESCYNKNYSQRYSCPVGSCRYPQEPKRNWTAERLVELSGYEVKCDNANLGCHIKMPVMQLRKHEKECRFRQIQCPETGCTGRVSRATLVCHFLRDHANDCSSDDNAVYTGIDCHRPWGYWRPMMLELDNPLLGVVKTEGGGKKDGRGWLRVFQVLRLRRNAAVIYVMGDLWNETLRSLNIEIKVKGSGVCLTYRGPLADIEENQDGLMAQDRGLVIPQKQLARIVGTEGRLVAKFRLTT